MQSIGNFIQQVSTRMESPLESLARLVKDVESVQIYQEVLDIMQLKLGDVTAQGNQDKQCLEQQQQIENAAAQINGTKRVPNQMTFGTFISQSVQAIIERQQYAVKQIFENISAIQAEQPNQNSSELVAQKIKKKKQHQQQQGNVVAPILQSKGSNMRVQKKVENYIYHNSMTFGDLIRRSVQALVQKNSQAVKQVMENLLTIEITKARDSEQKIKMGNPQEQLMGEQLQQLNQREKAVQKSSQTHNKTLEHPTHQRQEENSSFEIGTKVQQAKQYCQELRKHYFNQRLYTESTLNAFVHQILQTQKNNSYRCIQWGFQQLKGFFHVNESSKNQNKSAQKNSSVRNLSSGAQFNLQLTIRSKLSKQSGNYIDRQDSLIYSNATSFGLNAKSKQPSRHNSSTRLPRGGDELDQMIHIEKTSSKGEVENTENEFSVKSQSDMDSIKNLPKYKHSRNSANRSSQSGRSKTSREALVPPSNKNSITDRLVKPAPFIHQQENYQILPLTQQLNQNSGKKANINTFGIQTPDKPIKKSFSIKTYSNHKTQNSHTTHKPSHTTHKPQQSVFSVQISQLQSRISKIKETKLLRKIKLEEELKKVNIEIQQLKIHEIQQLKIQQEKQQNTHHSRAKHKSSHISSKQKSAYQSRIKINDDLQQKKKAANLVKSLRQQKISRQNHKRDQNRAFNADLHQQMEDIMRMKYFNEQRIKQKRQLQIIERMKQQEMRKIVQEKQKQQSMEFLSKLKQGPGVGLQKVQRLEKGARLDIAENNGGLTSKKAQDSLIKKTQEREIVYPTSDPALQKKRLYMKKMKNFTIIKKGQQDLYQQALN